MRHLLSIADMSKSEIDRLLEHAAGMKKRHLKGIPYRPLEGKSVALIFQKPSTRTRVSFEIATFQLGGTTVFITPGDSQIGRGEPVRDTARVMSRYVDCMVIRTYGHHILEEYAEYATVPVVNGLSDLHHPSQILADLLTLKEKKGGYEGLKVAWIGDGNNMANSWIEAAMILGFRLNIACPDGYRPSQLIMARAEAESDGGIKLTGVEEAADGADVLNTDVWASMGQEAERGDRIKAFEKYRIDSYLLSHVKEDAVVLHCLPAHRGEEITDDVIEGAHSAVWDQAENRLHIQKAILEWLI